MYTIRVYSVKGTFLLSEDEVSGDEKAFEKYKEKCLESNDVGGEREVTLAGCGALSYYPLDS
jgi:hypothetical protein